MVALAEHPEALELMPAVRECLTQFGLRRYQTCWALLEEHVFDAMKIWTAPWHSTCQRFNK
jgi:hypothetical protein